MQYLEINNITDEPTRIGTWHGIITQFWIALNVLTSVASELSHILIILFIIKKSLPMRPIDKLLLYDQVNSISKLKPICKKNTLLPKIVLFAADSIAILLMFLSIILETPIQSFFENACDLFNISLSWATFEKTFGGLTMALLRMFYAKMSSILATQKQQKMILRALFATQISTSIAVVSMGWIAYENGEKILVRAFCEGISVEFYQTLQSHTDGTRQSKV